MQYVHCLRSINNQSTAICRQILPVDIEVEYFCDNIIYHHPTSVIYFSVNTMHKVLCEIGMEVWKIVFHFILEIFHSILASSIFHTKISVPFHSIFHSIPCPGCRFYIIIIIVTFYPDGCSQVENPEAPDFEKIASAFGSLSTLSLPSLLPLPTSFIKVLPLPQKINRFQLPLPHP